MKNKIYLLFLIPIILLGGQKIVHQPWNIIQNQIESKNTIHARLNKEVLTDALDASPSLLDNIQSNIIVTFPTMKGSFIEFSLFYSPVMPQSLRLKFPNIRTYTGIGLDNPSERVSVTVADNQIKAMILGSEKSIFIDLVEDGSNVYRISTTEKGFPILDDCSSCEKNDTVTREDGVRNMRNFPMCVGEPEPCYSIGDTLVTFRFAGMLTAEANNEVADGSVFGGLTWLNAMVNQINLLWARELSFRLELIEDNDQLIYTDENPTPIDFTQFNMYDELPLILNHLNNTVGPGGYNAPVGMLHWEYGAVFNIGYAGGLAYVPGSTSANLPYYTIFNHEIGHNLGSSHNCTSEGGWRCSFGGTIMCSRSNTLGGNSGDQYSSHTIDIAIKYQQETYGGNAYLYQRGWSRVPTDNLPPTINLSQTFYTIPKETPFVLEGDADDENGENITYSWEQNDISTESFSPPNFPEDTGPLFCTIDPKVDGNIRYFPELASLLENNYETEHIEKLPFAEREINMRLMARDNDLISGGFSYGNVVLNVVDDAGPFRVTSQENVDSWNVGDIETITWDVANTANTNGVNSTFVAIYLSVDGGANFDIVLSSATMNDGSENIQVPVVPTSQNCRVMVKSLNNVFFDINSSFFTIQNGAEAQASVDTSSIALNLPSDTAITVERDIINAGADGSILTYDIIVEMAQNDEGYLTFDGEDDNVDLGANLLNGDGDFSISLWFKSTGADQVIIQQRNGGFNGEHQLKLTASGVLNFWTYRDGYQWAVTTSDIVNNGDWHHVVIVQDDAINGGRIFVNGEEQASNGGGLVNLAGSIHTYLGADMRDNVAFFSGSINDVSIFSSALSAFEISAIHNTGPGFNFVYNHDGFHSADHLVAFYPMTAMEGEIMSDASGNGFHGEMDGASWDGELIPVPEWLDVESSNTWLGAGESEQLSININTAGFSLGSQVEGNILIFASSDLIMVPVQINITEELSLFNANVLNTFQLYPAYPNPFNPVITIEFSLGKLCNTSLRIYDIKGRLVESLMDSKPMVGAHQIQWNASHVASGLYFVKLHSENKVQTEKIILLK